MQVLLEIKDDKSEHILAVLSDLKYVRIKEISNGRGNILQDFSESFEEIFEVLKKKKRAL